MSCDRIREQIPGVLAGRLDPAAREKLIDHLETCSACRADVAELGVVWRGLEAMAEPEPSPQMRARFLETLHAYEEGFQEAQRKQTYSAPKHELVDRALARAAGVGSGVRGRAARDGRLGRALSALAARRRDRRESRAFAVARAGGKPAATGGAVAVAGAIGKRPAARRELQLPDRAAGSRSAAGAAPRGQSRHQRERAALGGRRAGEVRRPARKSAARWSIPCRCRIRPWCRSR